MSIIKLSEGTEKHLAARYPHLSKEALVQLFHIGKVKSETMEMYRYNPLMYIRPRSYTLHLPSNAAEYFQVDEVTYIYPGVDGLIYTMYAKEVGNNAEKHGPSS